MKDQPVSMELKLAFAANAGRCGNARHRGCGAKIVWTLSERGKRFPLNYVPVDRDDHEARELFAIRLNEETGDLESIAVTKAWLDDEDPVFTSHWGTCPFSKNFRRT